MASPSPSPLLSCSVGHMFSYSSASLSANGTSTKCSLFAVLEARLNDLEARIRTLQTKLVASLASQTQLAGVGRRRAVPLSPPAAPKHQGNQER